MNKKIIEKVNAYFINALKRDVIPWQQSWHEGKAYNYAGKNTYNGINAILLNMYSNEYHCPAFLTFRQIQKLGGKVKKSAKSLPVIYWHIISKNIKDKEGNEIEKTFPMLRYYNVFNLKQTDIEYIPEDKPENKQIKTAEDVIKSYNDKPVIMQGKPAYAPGLDVVYIPDLQDFKTSDDYYAVLFHELSHSTGNKKRLNRFKESNAHFGSKDYSFEELIAEISSAYLRGIANIEYNLENSASYIKSWLQMLQNNPDWIIKASSKSRKAADYILGNTETKKEGKAA